jgi:phenylpyruvate tautomerase PptA (4-oxalocrotonate tautomerase family)
MPHVRIEIVKGRSLEERRRLFQAVHDALMEAFRIPDDDRTQRIIEHDPENFEIPPGSSDRYTLIEITAFPGRSAQAKGNLYRPKARRDRYRPDGRLGSDHRAHAGELGRPRGPLRRGGRPRLLARRLSRA